MTITLRLFAMLRERTGAAEMVMQIQEGATVADAEAQLLQTHPDLEKLLTKAAVAVNRTYASRQTVLQDGDELALIPPVSGG